MMTYFNDASPLLLVFFATIGTGVALLLALWALKQLVPLPANNMEGGGMSGNDNRKGFFNEGPNYGTQNQQCSEMPPQTEERSFGGPASGGAT